MWFLHGIVPLVYIVGILGIASAAAASFTSKHEEDTWISLTSTDLTGREIVFAKMFGVMRRGRLFGGVILFLATLDATLGAFDPLSIPLLILAMMIYAWAAAALGVQISLQLRSTWRTQFLTVTSLLLVNLFGQGVLNMLAQLSFAPQLQPGFTPYEISKLLLHAPFLEQLSTKQCPRSWWVSSIGNGVSSQTVFSVVSVLAYAALATLLMWHTLSRFEIVADQVRRSLSLLPTHPVFAIGTKPLPPPSNMK